MASRTKWLIIAMVWGPALLLAVAVSYFANISFWWSAGLVLAAWLINGIIAAFE